MNPTMRPVLFVAFLVLSLIIGLALSVYIHNRHSRVNRLLTLYLLNTSTWMCFGYLYHLFPELLSHFSLLQTAAGSFMGATFYLFTCSLVDERFSLRGREWFVILTAAGMFLWCMATLLIPDRFDAYAQAVYFTDFELHRPASPRYYSYTLVLVMGFGLGIARMVQGLRRESDPDNRRRIRNILFGTLVGSMSLLFFTNLSVLFGRGVNTVVTLVPIFLTLSWLSFSIIRHRLWHIDYLLERIREDEEKLAERNRVIEYELDLARLIQQRLLPATLPATAGVVMEALYRPMDKVGGDYYDAVMTDRGIDVMVVDVSGHGIASAFLSSMIKMAFHHNAGHLDGPGMLALIDSLVAEQGAGGMFATAVFCRIDPRGRSLRCCRAGHCPPLLLERAGGRIRRLLPRGRALGMNLGRVDVEELEVSLAAGDRLLLYTDGIAETSDPRGAFSATSACGSSSGKRPTGHRADSAISSSSAWPTSRRAAGAMTTSRCSSSIFRRPRRRKKMNA